MSPVRGPLPIGKGRSTGGTYNFYLLTIAVFWMVTLLGVIPIAWTIIWTIFFAVAVWIDPAQFSSKFRLVAFPIQLFHYARLVFYIVRRNLAPLILVYLLFLFTKPFIRKFDPIEAYYFWILYGYYLVVRSVAFAWYMWIALFNWSAADNPPFIIKKANFATQGHAVRHLVWSFCLGNVGLVARCAVYPLWIAGMTVVTDLIGGFPLESASPSIGLLVVVVCLGVWFITAHWTHIYYDFHRAIHHNKSLYDGLHRVHHIAQYPTLLDSGTECPFEGICVESSQIHRFALPSWWDLVISVMYSVTSHFPGHHTKNNVKNRFHVNHHRLYECNYGFPLEDAANETMVETSLPIT